MILINGTYSLYTANDVAIVITDGVIDTFVNGNKIDSLCISVYEELKIYHEKHPSIRFHDICEAFDKFASYQFVNAMHKEKLVCYQVLIINAFDRLEVRFK